MLPSKALELSTMMMRTSLCPGSIFFALVIIPSLLFAPFGNGAAWFPKPASCSFNEEEVASILKELDTKLKVNVITSPSSIHSIASTNDDLTWCKPTLIPMAIIRPSNEDDVRIAVPILAQLKKERGVDFRIKSGGHHYNAYSSVSNGIVLDLAKLNSYKLDKKEQTAWIGRPFLVVPYGTNWYASMVWVPSWVDVRQSTRVDSS